MSNETNLPAPQGQFLIYADGASQLQVRLEGITVWLTQKLIAELYGVSVKTVNEHLVNIYKDILPDTGYISNQGDIDVKKLEKIFGRLALIENEVFQQRMDELSKFKGRGRRSVEAPYVPDPVPSPTPASLVFPNLPPSVAAAAAPVLARFVFRDDIDNEERERDREQSETENQLLDDFPLSSVFEAHARASAVSSSSSSSSGRSGFSLSLPAIPEARRVAQQS